MESDLLDVGAECGVVTRSGTWYSFGETRLGQGRENARQFLKDNRDIYKQIRAAVLAEKMPKPDQKTEAADENGEVVANAEKSAEVQAHVGKNGKAPVKTGTATGRKVASSRKK
ncbi:MAG: hypothetical protein AB7N71_05600 [Phycisphaerae bacterium]